MKENFDDILKKVVQGTSDEADRNKLMSFFNQDEKEFEVKDSLLNCLEEMDDVRDEETNYNAMYKRLQKKLHSREIEGAKQKRKRRLFVFAGVAAVLFIGLIIGSLLPEITAPEDPVYYTAVSPKGSVSELVLPDSSIIYLNSGSEIRYSMDGEQGKREVFLTGEAWFNVKKSKKKAFVVHSPFFDVNVTGTEFNVKAYEEDEEVIVTLEEGAVNISSGAVKLAENIILKPGDQLAFNKENKKLTLNQVNTSLYTSWKDNNLVFINKSLKELIIILERKYGIDIQIADQSLEDYHFDGTIKDESVFEMLDLIKETLPIDYKVVDQKIIIEKQRLK